MRPIRSRTAALAAGLVASASLVTISSATLDSASAACAPGVKVVKAKGKATGARVKATRPAVAKVGRRYVARSTLTATTGRGTVTLTQTVCPNGTAGAAVQSTQSATARGTLAKGVTKKAATRKKAVKALKAAQKKAKRTLAAKAKRKSKKLAIAAAKRAAATKSHHALYDSTVVYLSQNGGMNSIAATPPAGAIMLRPAANGDLVLTFPEGSGSSPPLPCLTRAKAWPTAFLFDGGTGTSPVWAASAQADNAARGAEGIPIVVLPASTTSGPAWVTAWVPGPTTATHLEGIANSSAPAGFAAGHVCFFPGSSDQPAATLTLHGARVGTSTAPSGTAGLWRVTGGVPVTVG